LPLASRTLKRLHVLIRADGDPAALVQAVRARVQAAAPGTVVTSAYTFDQIIRIIGQEILVGTRAALSAHRGRHVADGGRQSTASSLLQSRGGRANWPSAWPWERADAMSSAW